MYMTFKTKSGCYSKICLSMQLSAILYAGYIVLKQSGHKSKVTRSSKTHTITKSTTCICYCSPAALIVLILIVSKNLLFKAVY